MPEKTEQLLQSLIFQILVSTSNQIILSSCLTALKAYLNIIKIQSQQFIERLTYKILTLLLNTNNILNNDNINNNINNSDSLFLNCLVIQTQAATLLPELFKLKNYNFPLLSANLKSILQIYFKLLNEIDLDCIVFCLKLFIEEFQFEIFGFATELAKELVESFKKFVVKDDLGKTTDDEERVASRILKALTKLVSLSAKLNGAATAKELELICFQLILWNLRSNFACIFTADNLNLLYEFVTLEFNFEKDFWVCFEEILGSLLVQSIFLFLLKLVLVLQTIYNFCSNYF